jgi:hypothetical protein
MTIMIVLYALDTLFYIVICNKYVDIREVEIFNVYVTCTCRIILTSTHTRNMKNKERLSFKFLSL